MDKNMRLKVIFEVSRCIVKNNMMIVSMIKEALKVSSKEYYEKWYEDRVLKDFTFATRANDLTVEDDCFINSNELIQLFYHLYKNLDSFCIVNNIADELIDDIYIISNACEAISIFLNSIKWTVQRSIAIIKK